METDSGTYSGSSLNGLQCAAASDEAAEGRGDRLERLSSVEIEQNLLQYELEGWRVWPALRFEVARALSAPLAGHGEGFRLRSLIPLAAAEIPRVLRPDRADCVMMTYTSALAPMGDGRCKDVYFDDLIPHLGRCLKIESLNSKGLWDRREKALRASYFTTTAMDWIVHFGLSLRPPPPAAVDMAREISNLLVSEFGLESLTPSVIESRIMGFYWKRAMYRWLFSRIRPRYVFSADGYGQSDIMAAAKELGATTIEMQHGIFTARGPEYAWRSAARAVRDAMPIPDRLFLWGDFWSGILAPDDFWGDRARVVGSLRVDHYRNVRDGLAGASQDGVREVVVTTQGLDVEGLIDWLKQALERVGTLPLRLTLKIHPLYDSSAPYLAAFRDDARVRVLGAHEPPDTYELMCSADVHISISSACHFEAIALGVPTVVAPLNGHEDVLSLCKAGHALLAQSPQALGDAMRELRPSEETERIAHQYFRPGAIANMLSELECCDSG